MNDNQNEAPAPTTEDAAFEQGRRKRLLQNRVAMLMDELRAIFLPEMKLTFIARNPNNPDMYTLLTEEGDMVSFAEFVKTMHKPEPITPPADKSDAVN